LIGICFFLWIFRDIWRIRWGPFKVPRFYLLGGIGRSFAYVTGSLSRAVDRCARADCSRARGYLLAVSAVRKSDILMISCLFRVLHSARGSHVWELWFGMRCSTASSIWARPGGGVLLGQCRAGFIVGLLLVLRSGRAKAGTFGHATMASRYPEAQYPPASNLVDAGRNVNRA